MISDDAKQTIDALSFEELLHEVMRDNNARFQGEKYDYLLARFALMKKREEDEHKEKQLSLAQEANDIAKAANATSSVAYRMSAFSVIVAIVALLTTVLQQCSQGR
jgi:hypothetical protein